MATDSDSPKSPELTVDDLRRTTLRVLYLAMRFEKHGATITPDSADDRERALLHRDEKRVLAKVVSQIDELYAGSKHKIDLFELAGLVDRLAGWLEQKRDRADWEHGRGRIAEAIINAYGWRTHSSERDERIRQVLEDNRIDDVFIRGLRGPRQAAEAILARITGYQTRSLHARRPEQAKDVTPLADDEELLGRVCGSYDEEGELFEYVLKSLGLEGERHTEAVEDLRQAYDRARAERDGEEETIEGIALVDLANSEQRPVAIAPSDRIPSWARVEGQEMGRARELVLQLHRDVSFDAAVPDRRQ